MSAPDDIKHAPSVPDDCNTTDSQTAEIEDEDRHEVFKRLDGQVDFRTVSWVRAGVIFLKSMAPETLSIDGADYDSPL